ncbi:MAG: DUF4416 family protein, partial [Candidatus Eisenbacteria bacterium]|nr:DUF4416 family protein [Candidatus Eisenbacteria bacterium]
MPLSTGPEPKVKLIAAVMAVREELIGESLSVLSPSYGSVELASPVFPFTYSSYYAAEMGKTLVKVFCSFRGVVDAGDIVARKLEAMACERQFVTEGTASRRVNIDPGYVDGTKLVLGTTKSASHRVYISSGVYGDVELVYKRGAFEPLEWTYPDYRDATAREFFCKVRSRYMAELRELERNDSAA